MNFTVEILRQDGPKTPSYWQRFEVPFEGDMTIEQALAVIRHHPITADGLAVRPVAFSGCGGLCECGACVLYANGQPIQACRAKLDTFSQPLRLAPIFPNHVIRDLLLDSEALYQDALSLKAYPVLDQLHLAKVMPFHQSDDSLADTLSACVACGACVAACPQVNSRSTYLGAYGLVQKRLFDRRQGSGVTWLGEDGISGCGESQNCVQACPLGLPVTEALASLKRQGTKQAISALLGWR